MGNSCSFLDCSLRPETVLDSNKKVSSIVDGESCHANLINENHHRVRFARDDFTWKCSIGNPKISLKNVKLLTRKVFMEVGEITKYEQLPSGAHFDPVSLSCTSRVLFVSHRWQDADNNMPDNNQRWQYKLVKLFLESEDGQSVTHLWLDYSCITQERGTEIGLAAFKKQLDNIQTAIFLSDVVLVVPRLVEERSMEGDVISTDLYEITNRGWCAFEAFTALMACCKLFVSFVSTSASVLEAGVVFVEVVAGASEGTSLTLEHFKNASSELLGNKAAGKEAGYAKATASATTTLELRGCNVPISTRNNWIQALDPWDFAQKVLEIVADKGNYNHYLLDNDNFKYGEKSVMELNPRVAEETDLGEKIRNLLPNFYSENDRVVVTCLVLQVATFALTGFMQYTAVKPMEELLKLIGLNMKPDEQDPGNCMLEIHHSHHMGPHDLHRILEAPFPEGMTPLPVHLSLFQNSFGVPGIRLIDWGRCGEGSIGSMLKSLDLNECSLKDEGAVELGQSLSAREHFEKFEIIRTLSARNNDIQAEGGRAIASSTTLTKVDIEMNQIGDEGALAFATNPKITSLHLCGNGIGAIGAKALAGNSVLTSLDLNFNHIGEEGARALAANKTLTSLRVWLENKNYEIDGCRYQYYSLEGLREEYGTDKN